MFFSGWLFAPLIVFGGWHDNVSDYLGVGVPVGSYFLLTVAVFLAPIYIIHNRMLLDKVRLSEAYNREANRLMRHLETKITEEYLKRFEFVKGLIAEIRSMPEWPVSSEISIRFIITSILMPIAVAVISASLRGGR